jgi:hypothetical protein
MNHHGPHGKASKGNIYITSTATSSFEEETNCPHEVEEAMNTIIIITPTFHDKLLLFWTFILCYA